MTQEDKDLLLKDLCARLPYGVKFAITNKKTGTLKSIGITKYGLIPINLFYKKPLFYLINEFGNIEYKPYLRTMSSMTDEEVKYKLTTFFRIINTNIEGVGYIPTLSTFSAIKFIDWLNKNMFDYRGLIEKGLALEAPEGMYNIKDK